MFSKTRSPWKSWTTAKIYGEERFILIGKAGHRLLAVVYTMRDERIRLISARAAESFEQRQDHEQDI